MTSVRFPCCVQEMLTMSLACMELQLEQWSLTKGKTGE